MKDMNIKIRNNFKDIDVNKVARILYEPYIEVPKPTDYVAGETRTIILRNKSTKELEQLKYRLVGAVPYYNREGFYWFWGEIEAEDYNSFLCFYFNGDGTLDSISATLSGNGPTDEEFVRINNQISYGAQFTSCGAML